MSSPNTTRLCVVRHGETAWNAQRRIQGQLDTPLNETGRRQAQRVAQRLAADDGSAFAAVYSSDLTRAVETASAAAHTLGLPVQFEAGLRERHYGLFQALTYDEAAQRHPQAYERFKRRDHNFDFGHGESLEGFARRVTHCVAALARRHVGSRVLMVTHGGVLDILRRVATGMSLEAARDFTIPNACLNWFEHAAGQWRLLSWGEEAAALDELPG